MAARAVLRWGVRALGVALAVLLVAAAAGVWWVGQSTSFLRWSLDRAVAASGGALEAGAVRGTLLGGFRIERLRWHDEARELRLEAVSIALRPGALLHGELRIGRIEVAQLQLVQRPSADSGPPAPPESLGLPIDLRIDALGIGRLTIAQPAPSAEPIVLEQVSFAGRYRKGKSGNGAWRIARLAATAPEWGEANLQGTLGARKPFDLEAVLELTPRIRLETQPSLLLPHVRVLADGTLEDFSVVAQALPPSGSGSGATSGPASGATSGSASGAPSGSASGATSGAISGSASGPASPPTAGVWIGVDTRVRPFAPTLPEKLAAVEITFDAVEPAQFGLRDVPEARLGGSATLRLRDDGLEGELRVENAQAGAIDRNALPLHTLRTSFAWASSVLSLGELHATLPGEASVDGALSIDFAQPLDVFGRSLPGLRGEARLREVDLSRLQTQLGRTRLSGTLRADRNRLELDIADASREDIGVAAALQLEGETLRIDRARLRSPAGSLEASGSSTLASPWRVDLAGRFAGVDPAQIEALLLRFGALGGPARLAQWDGRIGGSWGARGRAWPEPSLQTDLAVESGSLAGERLRLQWRGDVTTTRIAKVTATLDFGGAHASARGDLGRSGDRLQFTARLDALQDFDSRASGSASVEGELRGGWHETALGVVGRISARQLRWADSARIGSLDGSIAVPDLSRGRVDVDLRANRVLAAERRIDRLRLRVDGDLDAHTIRVDGTGPDLEARLSAEGALARDANDKPWQWQGRLLGVDAARPIPLRLLDPASVSVDGSGFALGDSAWRVDGAALKIATLAWRGEGFTVRGDATGLPVGRWARRFAPAAADSAAAAEAEIEVLTLDAQWDLRGADAAQPSGSAYLVLHGGPAAGQRGEANVVLDEGRLGGRIELDVPTLSFADRIIGPAWAVDGSLRFAGDLGGTIASPRVNGDLEGRSIALLQRELGWRLTGGTLQARFDGDRLVLRQLRLESGGGAITMTGSLLLDGLQGDFDLHADRLPVPLGPGERIVVSGASAIVSRGTALQWNGGLRVDEGLVELRGGDAPRLPDDVVIVGDEKRARPAAGPSAAKARAGADAGASARAGAGSGAGAGADTAKGAEPSEGLRVAADLKLDLGEKLRIRGSGVDVLLAGSLELRGTLPANPLAYGTVRVAKGSYSAYGQQLQITRGRVIFDGPIDNPVLDIVAMRQGRAVEAGVAVTGTVLSPRVRLVSDPEVPDAEKLSWLVLGVGFDDARSGAQMAALQAAGASLLGSSGGGVSGGLAQSLGLDVLTIRSASSGDIFDPQFGATFPGQNATTTPTPSAAQEVVAIGKRLSSRVLVTYEQGLRGVWNLLRIQYEITDRLSLRAQTGTDTALDLLYSFGFD